MKKLNGSKIFGIMAEIKDKTFVNLLVVNFAYEVRFIYFYLVFWDLTIITFKHITNNMRSIVCINMSLKKAKKIFL